MIKLNQQQVKDIYTIAGICLREKNIYKGEDNSVTYEDILSDIVFKSWTAIEKNYNQDMCSISTYIYQTVQYKVLDYKKKVAKNAIKKEEDKDYGLFYSQCSLNTEINSDDNNTLYLEDTISDNAEGIMTKMLRNELFQKLKAKLTDIEFKLYTLWLSNTNLTLQKIGELAGYDNPSRKNYQQFVSVKISSITEKLKKDKEFLKYLSNFCK
jgi:hypothetical protein